MQERKEKKNLILQQIFVENFQIVTTNLYKNAEARAKSNPHDAKQ